MQAASGGYIIKHAVQPVVSDPRPILEDAVQRVIMSRTLRSHAVLRQLLFYLAGKTLAGEAGGLKEYVVGVEAFAKPPSYDPQSDASVRVQVSRLRKCLNDYYEKECPDDPVRIDIPKGQFGIKFDLRDTGKTAERTPAASPADRRVALLTWTSAALTVTTIAALAALLLSWNLPSAGALSAGANPDLKAIWGTYLSGERPVLIVIGAPLFAKYTTSETGVFFRDPRLNEWEEAVVSPDLSKVGAAVGGAVVTPSWIYTGVGEATGAFLLARLLSHSNREVSLRRSHDLSWEDFRDRNVIVLGAPKHNRHLKYLPIQQKFVFSGGGILNLRPEPGEPETFDPKFSAGYEELEEDHALISRFPGLHGLGVTTVLAGASTEATLAAVEYATQPRYAAELTARLRGERGAMPLAYQVLVRARFKAQTPVEIRYVTHRLLENTLVVAEASPRR
jgi:hypothetical protein